jgi:predicted ATPase
MITELRLQNFKCFRKLDLPLARFTLLAGLNGMGKSSVIQSILLLRQSWRSGDLQASRLLLNGELTELGTGEDILLEGADEDQINIGLTLRFKNKTEKKADFAFGYDKESNLLQGQNPTPPGFLPGNELIRIAEQAALPPFGPAFHYVFAERFGPRKMLPLSEAHARAQDLGSHGQYVLHFLLEHGTKIELEKGDPRLAPDAGRTLLDQVDAWLQEISPGCHLNIDPVRRADSALSGFEFDRPGDVKTRAFRATNVGFGLSYALPVLVALLAAPTDALVLLENPEAHMHPRGQTRLGQLAARAASAGVQVILETHSDHVLDGARLCVRDGQLAPGKALFHYFERKGAEAFVITPKIDSDGRLDQWPSGFFDQHDENLANLLSPKRKS